MVVSTRGVGRTQLILRFLLGLVAAGGILWQSLSIYRIECLKVEIY